MARSQPQEYDDVEIFKMERGYDRKGKIAGFCWLSAWDGRRMGSESGSLAAGRGRSGAAGPKRAE